MFLELHIKKGEENFFPKLCISKDKMFNTWRCVFILDSDNDETECFIEKQQFPNKTFAIKELLNIPDVVGVREFTYKPFTPIEIFVKKYYKGED